jgi:hypothetical protein
LEIGRRSPLATFLLVWLLPTLKFYAILYFVLPGMRLLLILGLNRIRICRNTKRARLVSRVLGT